MLNYLILTVEPPAEGTMAALLQDFATVADSIFVQVTAAVGSITSNKFILFTTGFLFLGGCIGILRRLLSRS